MNPLAQALKSAANAIGNLRKDTHLTRFFRRIAYKKGRKEAITATAHKLAVIIYHMLTQYQAYQPYQKNQEQQKNKDLNKINRLMRKHKIVIEELDFDTENQ